MPPRPEDRNDDGALSARSRGSVARNRRHFGDVMNAQPGRVAIGCGPATGGRPAVWDLLVEALQRTHPRRERIRQVPASGQTTMAEAALRGDGVCPVSASLAQRLARPGLVFRPLDPSVHVPATARRATRPPNRGVHLQRRSASAARHRSPPNRGRAAPGVQARLEGCVAVRGTSKFSRIRASPRSRAHAFASAPSRRTTISARPRTIT